jgi:phosphatidate phosphatase APP1
MTLSIPLSSEVFVATDAEGRDIFTTEVSVRYININYESGAVNAECTLPNRTDVAFARVLTDLDDTSESTLVAALALDIEANFPAEKPPEAEPEAPPEDAPEEEPAE